MKIRIHLLFIFLGLTSISKAQITIFQENFDAATHSMVSTGSPGFGVITSYFNTSPKSINGQFSAGTESTLETPALSFAGFSYVVLSFNHICKVSFFDSCLVEYSINNG